MHKMHMKHITMYLFGYHCRFGLFVLIIAIFIFITTIWGVMHYITLLHIHAILFICSGYHCRRGIICPVSQRQMTLRLRCRSSNGRADSQRADGTIHSLWRNDFLYIQSSWAIVKLIINKVRGFSRTGIIFLVMHLHVQRQWLCGAHRWAAPR